MTIIRRLFLTSTLALAAVGFASADQIVQTFSLPPGGSTNGTSWSYNDAINQFDTTLGTLEYIQIVADLSTTVNAGAVDANSTPGTGTDTYIVGGTTSLNLTDGSSELLSSPSVFAGSTFTGESQGASLNATNASGAITATSTWYADTGFSSSVSCEVVGNDTLQAGCLGTPYVNPSSETIVDPLNLSLWESASPGSTITLTGNASTAGMTSGSAAYTGGYANGTANALVTVIYDYTPGSATPEPSTMALFGSGLVGLGLLRRRLKKS